MPDVDLRSGGVPRIITTAAVMLAVGALVTTIACAGERPYCYAGEYLGCGCENGARGYQVCVPAGDAYEPCKCDGTTPGIDASASTDSAPPLTVDAGKP